MSQDVFGAASFAAGDWGWGGFDGVGFYTGGQLGTGAASLSGTVSAFGDPIQARFDGQTLTLAAYAEVAGGIVLTTPDFSTFYVFMSGGFDPAHAYPLTYAFNSFSAPCFVAGTRIATDRGEIPVEALQIGDRVVALRGLRFAEVTWLGHRDLDCRGLYRGRDVWPVRIAAHAFARNQPRRDLLLSPDHAIFVDGELIPVRYLLNGATIVQERVDSVSYWHVELPSHEVLLAEGLAAESYLETGNRALFGDAEARRRGVAGASPQFALLNWQQRACAPLRLDPAYHDPVRRRLLARAAALGHATTDDPALCLLADGHPLAAAADGWRWQAALPHGTRRLRIVSRSAVPAHVLAESQDHRCLGVAVTGLSLDGAPVPDAHRTAGWHTAEAGLQWTDGSAEVLCDPAARSVELTAAPLLRYWLSPRSEARLAA